MPSSPIKIGSITLQDFEIPPSVRFGGRYRLKVHSLANGNRVVERLGPDDSDISFRGIFSGPEAESRAQAMNNLRLAGNVVWLSWESFRYPVIVKTFLADYQSPWWISYQLSCVVAQQSGTAVSSRSALIALVTADLGYATAAIAGTAIQLNSLETALANGNALVPGTSSNSAAVAAVDSALVGIDQQITERSSEMASAAGLNAAPGGFGRVFGGIVASAGALAASVSASAYVKRIGTRLTQTGE